MKIIACVLCLMVLSGCAGPKVTPSPVRVGGADVRVSSVRVFDNVDFDADERRFGFTVSLKARDADDMPDRYGRPFLSIDRIVDAQDEVYTESGDDGVGLTAMVVGGMPVEQRDDDIGQMSRGCRVEDDQRMPREVTIEGTLTQGRVTSIEVFDLPLEMEASEIIDRLAITTERGTLTTGQGRVSVRVQVEVVDESRDAPNTPIRIEIVDSEGGVLTALDSSSGRFGRGSINFLYSSIIDDAAAGVRVHVATGIEWDEMPFVIERVPVGGPVAWDP